MNIEDMMFAPLKGNHFFVRFDGYVNDDANIGMFVKYQGVSYRLDWDEYNFVYRGKVNNILGEIQD